MKKILILLLVGLMIGVSGCAGIESYQKRWSDRIEEIDKDTFKKDHAECSGYAYQTVEKERAFNTATTAFIIIPYGGFVTGILLIVNSNKPAKAGDATYRNCMVIKGYTVYYTQGSEKSYGKGYREDSQKPEKEEPIRRQKGSSIGW